MIVDKSFAWIFSMDKEISFFQIGVQCVNREVKVNLREIVDVIMEVFAYS